MTAPPPGSPARDPRGVLRRVVDVRPEELRAVFLSFAFFFFVLGAWYIVRPIRDEMGIAGGARNLPWLFTGTMLATLAGNALFSEAIAKIPVRRCLPLAYRFVIVNFLLFAVLLRVAPPGWNVWLGRVFFIWSSVLNLFLTAMFWSFMADTFTSEQGKRLFAFIGAGGTAGGMLGSTITTILAPRLGSALLLVVGAMVIEAGVRCMNAVEVRFNAERDEAAAPDGAEEEPLGGSALESISHVLRSPYLFATVLFMLLFTVGSTYLYQEQATILGAAITDRDARTAFLARLDLFSNGLALVVQLTFAGRLIRGLGVGKALAILPAISIAGFSLLARHPTVVMLGAFSVLRRGLNFAVTGPTLDVLFTVVSREDRYKSKGLIDTFVYRVGDQMGAWSYRLITTVGGGLVAAAYVAVPLSVVWLGLALWLGRRQAELARQQELALAG